MKGSIIGATYDLLEFAGSGDFSQFERCFTKACRYFSCEPDEGVRRKLRNIAFRFLRTTGFLDVLQQGGKTRWFVAPPTLVQRAVDDFVFIGSSRAAKELQALVSTTSTIVSGNPSEIPNTILFYPPMLQVSGVQPELRSICSRVGVAFSAEYQRQFFRALPATKRILDAVLVTEALPEGLGDNQAEVFDFASCEWLPFNETRPTMPGLFRTRFRFGPPRYFIAEGDRRLEIFNVLVPEWLLVAVLARQNRWLQGRYHRGELRLDISRRYQRTMRMPVLLERALRSGTLLQPAANTEWLSYHGIASQSVKTLINKYPFINVKELP